MRSAASKSGWSMAACQDVPDRAKTDVLDCQWIQKLHSFGLLSGSFRPDQQIRTLRSLMRLRDNLVRSTPTKSVHHMQKALFEMNVQLSNVISDIVGESGMRILEAILAGERDPEALARLCSSRIKASRQTVAKAGMATGARSCSSHCAWPWTPIALLKVKSPSAMNASPTLGTIRRSRRVGHPACEHEERVAVGSVAQT